MITATVSRLAERNQARTLEPVKPVNLMPYDNLWVTIAGLPTALKKSLVGEVITSDRQYFLVFSRIPQMDETIYQQLAGQMADKGCVTEKLDKTQQAKLK